MPLDYLAVLGAVFAINLLPAFGPPTSLVLVALTLNSDLSAPALVVCGAIAAATGRLVLAKSARRVRPHLSSERRRHLAAFEEAISSRRASSLFGLGLFALSPIPSGQLFTAAGLMGSRVVPLTLAFFSGRVVSYAIYVTGASAIKASAGREIVDAMTSPAGVAVQLAALVALIALLRVDWADVLSHLGDSAGHGRGAD